MTKTEILEKLKSKNIKEIFTKNNIKHLYLIGSYARWDNSKDSDIDVLYELEKWKKFTLFNIGWIKYDFEKKVWISLDLVDKNDLNKDIINFVDRNKILVF